MLQKQKKLKIMLTGGGTIGSVSPLLAISQKIKEKNSEVKFLFLGTYKGRVEKELVKNYKIPFQPIFSGKLRRYLSFKNFIDLIFIFLGFVQSFFIILKFRPNVIVSAGSFVSVPVIWAGWILKIPSLIHQQDAVPGLANKLMAPFATKITVVFEKSLKDFPKDKTILTGNPTREDIFAGDKKRAREIFKLEKDLPVILFIGGGTGALALNKLIIEALLELTKFCQIIHLTGKNKNLLVDLKNFGGNYHAYDFLTKEMPDAYAAADLVVCRAGMGTLTEISLMGQPAIIIPIPNSHQEKNAEIFSQKNAAILLNQRELTPEILIQEIKNLLNNQEKLKILSENINKVMKSGAMEKIIEEINKICGKK
ncbi:MAG: UDP-N-acetylglucosamine--N-acetylmuramyl-(pentapeptide) pyrophosphoryl-undecaprenol N-acetylglucosamine transferase [Parcubacteria group bacterium Athens1014_10]|nr:MAG: UDP-N-acetylglucosamine--N-acetylmuramyl-(pentapeptide) pyrophosphoryl-undecaprenol N-acetylglucosamine transferase [Parcubacteria group bacterium Athens1014_10]TSD06063.1 MAG: UDP-N-acetylglucosamine--N-acetylmuramyl-(pentapeptide) pyrophosphoryl-undecaprenol N-acetylglucosamine transferase [Parcubacteria group bacterium Athens0714_12]